MPKVTVTPHGIKGGRASGMNRTPPKRGKAKGWTASAARRNRDFLKSIDPTRLTGGALSATLTFGRSQPVGPADMQRIRDNFFDRLRRDGVARHHWVMEFQTDGTPHLHMMIFYDDEDQARCSSGTVMHHWHQLSKHTGATDRGQHVTPVHHLTGWLQYLAKHGARGAAHMQRTMPEGWENPGRMWGKMGVWHTLSEELEVDAGTFYRLRRWVRNWRLADAREDLRKARLRGDEKGQSIARRRIASARSLLSRGDRQRSELMGFDEWAKPHVVEPMLDLLSARDGSLVRPWAERETVPTEPPRSALPKKGRRIGGAGPLGGRMPGDA